MREAVAAIGAADSDPGVKERVLRAAIHEFAATGFHRTSLRSVSARAGTNKPMVYYHFQSKDGLYFAAAQRLLEETAAHLREALAEGPSALSRLRRYAEVYLDAFLVSRPLLGTALQELEGLESGLRARLLEAYTRLILPRLYQILVDGMRSGEFRTIHVEECVLGVTSLLNGYVRPWHRPAEQIIRTAIGQLMDYYAVGLLSDEALPHQRPNVRYTPG